MAQEPINLRRWKKRRARDDKRAEGAANARAHGRTGAEKRTEKAEAEREARLLDGHRLDDPNLGDDEN